MHPPRRASPDSISCESTLATSCVRFRQFRVIISRPMRKLANFFNERSSRSETRADILIAGYLYTLIF